MLNWVILILFESLWDKFFKSFSLKLLWSIESSVSFDLIVLLCYLSFNLSENFDESVYESNFLIDGRMDFLRNFSLLSSENS